MTQDNSGTLAPAAATRDEPARFDYYAATVQDTEQALLGALSELLRADVAPGQALHGYEKGYELRTAGAGGEQTTVARVLAGGRNGWPHVWASGDHTMPLVAALRRQWPLTHRVSRVDSALDYRGEGTWQKLLLACYRVADPPQGRKLRLDQKGDWYRQDSPAGRTLYVGSSSAPAMVRLYEKGKQLRGEASPAARGRFDLTWVRLELQLRPERTARTRAALAGPLDIWGYGGWTRKLLAEIEGVEVERVQMHENREADDERAFSYMVKQYGPLLERIKDSVHGRSWADVGEMIGARIMYAGSESGADPFSRRPDVNDA